VKQFLIIYISVFMAEVGDKTQLATLLFATESSVSRTGVFVAASAALVSTTLLAVLAGGVVTRFVSESTLKMIAGVGFIVVGVWTLSSRTS
jgi:putative Ca2+/H+ antiporter (TMEM165/GDT1 family)